MTSKLGLVSALGKFMKVRLGADVWCYGLVDDTVKRSCSPPKIYSSSVYTECGLVDFCDSLHGSLQN